MHSNLSRHRSMVRIVAVLAAVILVAAACNWRGPAPTDESIEAPVGPFEYATIIVPSSVSGFGGGTIWYPTTDEHGEPFAPDVQFGGVAVVPGYVSAESSIAWYGPKLASNGFVVITIATSSIFNFPTSRGEQLLAALDHLTGASDVAHLVDEDRLGVMGWSMGGGGALHAADIRPELRAAVPLAAWHDTKDWSTVTVPTMLVSCENDSTAPNSSHSIPFYESLPDLVWEDRHDSHEELDGTPLFGTRAYVEVAGGGHNCVTSDASDAQKVTVSRSVLPWLKLKLDGDTRYEPWVCPAPVAAELPALSDSRSNCED